MIAEPKEYLRKANVSELFRKIAKEQKPYHAFMELTMKCNLKCFHCYVDCDVGDNILPDESNKQLSLEEIKKVLSDLGSMGVMSVAFTGGEPFLRDDIIDICKYTTDCGISVKIFTNGTLITPQISRALKGAGVRKIEISLYGATHDTNAIVTKIPESYNQSIQGIRNLLNEGLSVRIGTTFMKQNKEQATHLSNLVSELGIDEWRVNYVVWRDALSSKNTETMQLSKTEIKLIQEELKTSNPYSPIKLPLRACMAGIQFLTITPTGNVLPCTLAIRKIIGNIREQSIKEIWANSLELQGFVAEFDSASRLKYIEGNMLEKGLRPRCQIVKKASVP